MTNTEQQNPENALLAQLDACVNKIIECLDGEPLVIGAAACLEASISMILAPTTDAATRANFAQMLMQQAHMVSGVVSQEQADGPMTVEVEAKPQIYLGG